MKGTRMPSNKSPWESVGTDREQRKTDKLIAQDRNRLSSFVKNLNNGVTIDDMHDELKSWWINRY